MGLFDSFSGADKRFLDAFEKIANAAKTAADAYAKSVDNADVPKYIVNINHEPLNATKSDIERIIKQAIRNHGVQDQ